MSTSFRYFSSFLKAGFYSKRIERKLNSQQAEGHELGEEGSRYIWEARVPKNIWKDASLQVLRFMLCQNNHIRIGRFGGKIELTFILGLVDL